MISKDNNAVVQSQIAVTAYIPSKQLMSSGFVEQNWQGSWLVHPSGYDYLIITAYLSVL